jgi:hypothetical protein
MTGSETVTVSLKKETFDTNAVTPVNFRKIHLLKSSLASLRGSHKWFQIHMRCSASQETHR